MNLGGGGGESSMYIRAKLVKNVIINIVDATKGDWVFELIKSLFTFCFSSPWEIHGSSEIGLAMSTYWINDWNNYYWGGNSSPQWNGNFSLFCQSRIGADESRSSTGKHPSHHKIKPMASNRFKISSTFEEATTTMEVERIQLITSFMLWCKNCSS